MKQDQLFCLQPPTRRSWDDNGPRDVRDTATKKNPLESTQVLATLWQRRTGRTTACKRRETAYARTSLRLLPAPEAQRSASKEQHIN